MLTILMILIILTILTLLILVIIIIIIIRHRRNALLVVSRCDVELVDMIAREYGKNWK
jgi:hypothetical protein